MATQADIAKIIVQLRAILYGGLLNDNAGTITSELIDTLESTLVTDSTVTTALGYTPLSTANTAVALVNAATMDLTSTKHTLSSSEAARTFTISYTGDDITLEVTLSTTAATYTFPATALCVSEGIASGDNTLSLSGVSGDKYVIAIKKVGSAYYVVSKNFGQ